MSAPSPAEWRAAMGQFASGVTIVTSWDGETPVGTTVNAFCSVSLDPPLLLACVDFSNPVLGPIERSGVLGVNILGAESCELARRFGRKSDDDKFAGVAYHAEGGAPRLEAAPVFIDCRLEQAHDAGDHKIVIGRGVRVHHAASGAPLLYHKGAFPSPADPAAWG